MPCDGVGTPISSTEIRKAIHEGHLEDANGWLGRPFQFKGTVIKGDQRGRTLGFPTLNLLLLMKWLHLQMECMLIVYVLMAFGMMG